MTVLLRATLRGATLLIDGKEYREEIGVHVRPHTSESAELAYMYRSGQPLRWNGDVLTVTHLATVEVDESEAPRLVGETVPGA